MHVWRVCCLRRADWLHYLRCCCSEGKIETLLDASATLLAWNGRERKKEERALQIEEDTHGSQRSSSAGTLTDQALRIFQYSDIMLPRRQYLTLKKALISFGALGLDMF